MKRRSNECPICRKKLSARYLLCAEHHAMADPAALEAADTAIKELMALHGTWPTPQEQATKEIRARDTRAWVIVTVKRAIEAKAGVPA